MITRSTSLRRAMLSHLRSIGLASLAAGAFSVLPVLNAGSPIPLLAGGQAWAQEEGSRPPPPTRSSQTLSRAVYTRIEEVMELREEEDWAAALEVLGEIRELHERGRLNEYETYTLWQFYGNIAQMQENYEQALEYYSQMVEVPNLTVERLEQGWFLVASLRFMLEDYEGALQGYQTYLDISPDPDSDIYLRMGQALYQLERYADAIPYVERSMEAERARGVQPRQSTYELLRALHMLQDDFEAAKQVIEEMIVLFNEPGDWNYLAQINGQLDLFEQQGRTYYVAYHGGYLEDESALVSTAAILSNNDNPYEAAQIMETGMEAGLIEESVANLDYLSQFWQLAREDERALEPLRRAAEMTEERERKAELYGRLARLYLNLYEFRDAIEAYNEAFEIGGLKRPDQALIMVARAYMELNQYDDAIAAARQAQNYEESRDDARNWIQLLESEKRRYETLQNQREQYKGYFRNEA